jgi:hypothetical protein
MIKINENLNVFDADRHDLESPLGANIQSFKNGSAHKSSAKRDSDKRKTRIKNSRNDNVKVVGSYSKYPLLIYPDFSPAKDQ